MAHWYGFFTPERSCDGQRIYSEILRKRLSGIGSDGSKVQRMYEELLADYMDMEHEMAVSVYLLGAEDREKMLR